MNNIEDMKKNGTLNRNILFALLIVEIIVFSLLSAYFMTVKNIMSIGLNTSVLGLVAIGQTLCIITSNFDLSCGNTAAFTGFMSAFFFQNMKLPFAVSFLLAMLIAALIGLVNGLFITKLKISAFITTMATNFILGGMLVLVSHGQAIIVSDKSYGLLGKTTLTPLRFTLPMLIMFVFFFAFAWILKNTVFGRRLYCVGGNTQAARISGINIDNVHILTFVLSALLSGFAGIVLASRMNAAQITVGSTYSMESIAAAVLGGTALSGGTGTMIGTFIGVLVTGILSNGLTMIGTSQAWRDIATGLLLLFAIILQNSSRKDKN